MGLEKEAMDYISQTLMRILFEILESAPENPDDLLQKVRSAFPTTLTNFVTKVGIATFIFIAVIEHPIFRIISKSWEPPNAGIRQSQKRQNPSLRFSKSCALPPKSIWALKWTRPLVPNWFRFLSTFFTTF